MKGHRVAPHRPWGVASVQGQGVVERKRRTGIKRQPRLPVSGTPEAREKYLRERGK